MNPTDATPTLRSRIISAGFWVFGGHIASQLLRLASNLIMTRLLVPEMFGVMALASVFLVGMALFSDFGLNQNIIQSKRGADPLFLNTVWTVQIVRGGLLWLLALGLAFALNSTHAGQVFATGSAYADPILPLVFGVLAFSAAINGFTSTKLATANRNVSLGLITRIELSSQVVTISIMMGWAMIDRSIWALVSGSLAGGIVKVALSHLLMPGARNRLAWDGEAFREIFAFGKWVFLASILGFLALNGDRLILGGLIDSSTLGLYVIALFLMNATQKVISKLAASVAFPALSEVARERPADLKEVYYKFRGPVDAILLLAAGTLFVSGSSIVEVLYDDRYLDAGIMLEILSVALIVERYNMTGQCFLALGKPGLLIPVILCRVIALAALMPLANVYFGLHGMLWVIATSGLFGLPVLFYFKKRLALLDGFREIQMLPLLFVGCLFGYLLEIVFNHLLPN